MQLIAAEDGHHNDWTPVSEAAQAQQALHLHCMESSCSISQEGAIVKESGVVERCNVHRKLGSDKILDHWHAHIQSLGALETIDHVWK